MIVLEYLMLVLKHSLYVLALGVLPYLLYAFIMQKISGAIRTRLAGVLGIKGYIYLTAPGVIVHELSHAFFCVVFGHKIQEMKLFSPEEDGTLGYVNHSYNPGNMYHRIGNFFIGTGPIWGGVLVLYLVSRLLLQEEMLLLDQGLWEMFVTFIKGIFSWDFISRWQSWVWLYLVLTVSSHIILSAPDLKGAKEGFSVLILGVLLFTLCFSWWDVLNEKIGHALENMLSCTWGLLGAILLITAFFAVLLSVLIRKR